jgi:AraC-like DNA-binding protein
VERFEIAAGIGSMIVQLAAARGVDAAALATAAGFVAPAPGDADARILLAVETALWDEAAHRSGDDAFGAHAAAAIRPGMFDVLDYAVRTAPTLRVALERLARYNRLVHDAAVFALEDRGPLVRVTHALHPGAAQSRHAAEFTLASLLVIGGQLAGRPLPARAVELFHPAPAAATVTALAAVFGVTPRFAAPANALELAQVDLERPLPGSDPALSRIIERHAEALLAARPEPRASMSQRVRQALAGALGQGDGERDVSLAAVAQRLGTSERSLQRHLADEGVSFDALYDELRRELAERYLSDRSLAIAEVAYLLGYSEPSAFHRAFKRWTGATPAEARRRAA